MSNANDICVALAKKCISRLVDGYNKTEGAFKLLNGCVLHNKAIKERYPKMKAPGIGRSEYYIHHLVVRSKGEKIDRSMEVSHLCHQKRCINPDHIIQETGKANRARQCCKMLKPFSFICSCGEITNIWSCPHQPQCLPHTD
jgi:hypothetical protein